MWAQDQETPSQAPTQKITDSATAVMYPSWIMKNALVSLVNLVTLLIGIGIGVMLAPHFEKGARAATGIGQSPPASTLPQSANIPVSPLAPSGVEQISPGLTVGSVGVYLLLSHHVQSDELVVNGIDLLKLHEGELGLLSRIPGVSPLELQGIVNSARDTHLYQVARPKPSQQSQPGNTPKK